MVTINSSSNTIQRKIPRSMVDENYQVNMSVTVVKLYNGTEVKHR